VATERSEDASQVIFALANAVEAKDAYTEGHTERVGALAVEAGRVAGLDGETCEALRQGGVLHDIGKIGIPNEIINKAGRLTDKERIVMNKHPIIGERICEPLKSLRHLLPIIRWHHEKLDGTGYPTGSGAQSWSRSPCRLATEPIRARAGARPCGVRSVDRHQDVAAAGSARHGKLAALEPVGVAGAVELSCATDDRSRCRRLFSARRCAPR